MNIGILALQGGYCAHQRILEQLKIESTYVRTPKDLKKISGLILPGGESTTILKFLMENDFLQSIKDFAKNNFLLGTCAGAILLAKEVINPSQPSLELVDVTVQRNAYGTQLASRIGKGFEIDNSNMMDMVFIRAPRIVRVGPNVTIIASYQGDPVGVQENNYILTTFHPELTSNTSIHERFINMIRY